MIVSSIYWVHLLETRSNKISKEVANRGIRDKNGVNRLMKALFVEYPKCTTCKKALNYLKSHNVEVEDRHIVENVPTEAELKEWMDKSGLEFKKFFNTSGQLYREMGLKDQVKTMSQEEAIKLLATNGMLIKRPILVTENSVCVGFKEAQYEEVLKNNRM